jgi:Ni/Co efflux regulator RcnB
MTRTLWCVLLAAPLATSRAAAQTSRRCAPMEAVAMGRHATDSVRIESRTVPRTESAVREAWKLQGRTASPTGTDVWPGERLLVYRDSQPDLTAIYDGCRLVPEQLPLPTYWAPDSVINVEFLPSATVARVLNDHHGYQAVRYVTRRKP